jgi:hypothetical protein
MVARQVSVLRDVGSKMRYAAMLPLWSAELLTGAKSFMDNPVIGSTTLNRYGLHTGRMALAHRAAQFRRERLRHLIPDDDRASFDRDGFLMKPDFLPANEFDALRSQVQGFRGVARETFQGNAVTRRVALSQRVLAELPAVQRLLRMPQWRGPIRYAWSYDAEPINYIQTILSHAKAGPDDPQCALHADTFHPTVKAWLFLTDVAEDEGPFSYVAGSHRFSPQRRAWERAMSVGMADQPDRLTRRGSFRVRPDELDGLGLPQATKFAVRANTLIVADTHGFHARAPSARPTCRVEIWASGRRNPFLPWPGLDIWSIPGLGESRIPLFWRMGDLLEAARIKPNFWRPRAGLSPFDGI